MTKDQKKKPDQAGEHKTGFETTNDLDCATAQRHGGSFEGLQAAYAEHGHRLHRVVGNDGAVAFYAEKWGLHRYLPTLHDAALFLAQIGGRL